jgi:SnoaL-like domain
MKTNAKDYVSTAQQFFTAYDAHDVDGMLALCADGALGRYAPYGRESVAPIRGGIDVIWRAFPDAVPNFRVKVIQLIPAEGNVVVIQAEMSGPIPAEVHGIAKKGQDVHIPSLLHSTFRYGLQNHTARRLLGQHRPQPYQGERRVTERANCKICDLRRLC